MKEKKTKNIIFRCTESEYHEVKESQYTYHEVFLLGLQCIRDESTYRLVKIRELEEEVRDLREEINYYDFLKKKLQDKEQELQNKKNEYDHQPTIN